MIAGAHDEKRIAMVLIELQGSAFEQGRAVERGDHAAAAQHHREGLAAVDSILRMIAGERILSVTE